VKRLSANVNDRLSLEISKTLFLTYVPPLENITDTNTNLKWRLSKKYSSYLAKTFLVEKCFIIIIFQLLDGYCIYKLSKFKEGYSCVLFSVVRSDVVTIKPIISGLKMM